MPLVAERINKLTEARRHARLPVRRRGRLRRAPTSPKLLDEDGREVVAAVVRRARGAADVDDRGDRGRRCARRWSRSSGSSRASRSGRSGSPSPGAGSRPPLFESLELLGRERVAAPGSSAARGLSGAGQQARGSDDPAGRLPYHRHPGGRPARLVASRGRHALVLIGLLVVGGLVAAVLVLLGLVAPSTGADSARPSARLVDVEHADAGRRSRYLNLAAGAR